MEHDTPQVVQETFPQTIQSFFRDFKSIKSDYQRQMTLSKYEECINTAKDSNVFAQQTLEFVPAENIKKNPKTT